jgi:hypothetical protein
MDTKNLLALHVLQEAILGRIAILWVLLILSKTHSGPISVRFVDLSSIPGIAFFGIILLMFPFNIEAICLIKDGSHLPEIVILSVPITGERQWRVK